MVDLATLKFKVKVDEDHYKKATSIEKAAYFVGINDCITYAADVAEAIEIPRSTLVDVVVTPVGYVETLIERNR